MKKTETRKEPATASKAGSLFVECGVIFFGSIFVFGFCITFIFKSYFNNIAP